MEKTTGIKLPTPFPKTLEIERTDSHIPSAPAAAAKLTQIQNPKGPSTVRLTFAPFRLILQLEKTSLVPSASEGCIPSPMTCEAL
jgi:uncharacterized membrane protein YfhO